MDEDAESEGYDLERQDTSGVTALLSHAISTRALSANDVAMLSDEGADPKAVDNDGCNALHKVVQSINNGELLLENIYRKLRLLMAGSCAVNQCDIWGQTPFDDALSFGCWDEWCSALLAACGYDVHNVLRNDRVQKEKFVQRNTGLATDVHEGIHDNDSTIWEAVEVYLELTKEFIEFY